MLSLRCCREVCQSRISAIASLWTPRAEPAGRGGALRISYHTYRGLPGVLASLCDGVLFGLAYLQRRQLWPLILTHTVVIERDESRREELLHDQQSAGGRHGNESRMVEGAAVQNCLSRPEVGGVGAQVVLKVLVVATAHGRSFGCNSADLGTGFVRNTEAVRGQRPRA